MPRIRRDRGSTSLVMTGLLAVVATLVVALGEVGVVSATASRAQGAADACALAAASEARDLRALGWPPTGDPCEAAAAVADEWRGVVEGCSVDGDGAVTVTVGMGSGGVWISRSARAGTG